MKLLKENIHHMAVRALASPKTRNFVDVLSFHVYLYVITEILDTSNTTAAIPLALSFQFHKVFQWHFMLDDH